MKTNEIVDKRWLLRNGFVWSEYANNPAGDHSGEYVLWKHWDNEEYLIWLRFRDKDNYGNPAFWDVKVSNGINERDVKMYNCHNVAISDLKAAVKLCCIKVKFYKVSHERKGME